MAIGITRQAYYPPNEVQTGLYTNGNEFVLYEDYTIEYEGLYHKLPNGQIWTRSSPHSNSKRLQEKRFDFSDDVKTYNAIRGNQQINYVRPIEKQVMPDESDYERGYFYRYFIQKKNTPHSTIMEIDADQLNRMNRTNNKGINVNIWHTTEVQWYLKGKYASNLNKRQVEHASKSFKGLEKYIFNYLEYVK